MKGRLLWAALLAAACAGMLVAQGRRPSVRSACGADCRPQAGAFEVPQGARAEGFRLEALEAGVCCSGGGSRRMAGFSIRQGSRTMLVYYMGAKGPVSDPVPLGALTLQPGRYELVVVPARGATAVISYGLTGP